LDWRKHVVFDAHYARPLEVDCLMADIRKAKAELGWSPTIDFDTLVKIMVDADLTAIGLWDKSEGTGRAAVIKQYEGTEEHGWHTWKDQIVSMEDR
jgi:GDPmannose 4,6-dehydratase